MKEKKMLLSGLLFSIVLISFSGLVIFGIADAPPLGEPGVDITYYYPGQNCYYDLKITWKDAEKTHTQWYPGWCVDSEVYIPGENPYAAILVPSCSLIGGEDPTIEEDWNKINYLMNQWAAGTYSGATWVDIQQVIWFYGDDGYAINTQHPHGTESKINWIIDHVNDNAPDPEQCEGPEYAIIGVARAENKQKVFFMIPEIPLGTLGAGLTMLSAFMAKRKRTKTQ